MSMVRLSMGPDMQKRPDCHVMKMVLRAREYKRPALHLGAWLRFTHRSATLTTRGATLLRYTKLEQVQDSTAAGWYPLGFGSR